MARRGKDIDWEIYKDGQTTWDKVPVAVLMDIRDELKLMRGYMNAIHLRLTCHDCLAIPRMLRRISANTEKPKKAKV